VNKTPRWAKPFDLATTVNGCRSWDADSVAEGIYDLILRKAFMFSKPVHIPLKERSRTGHFQNLFL
jgi:hypothetical protein